MPMEDEGKHGNETWWEWGESKFWVDEKGKDIGPGPGPTSLSLTSSQPVYQHRDQPGFNPKSDLIRGE